MLSYKWAMTKKPSGSKASLFDPTISAPQFTVDLVGMYRISLIVNDGALDSSSDEVIITANALACSTDSACSANEFCKKADGDCNGIGRCTEKQGMMCTTEYKPVCGCDGKTYGNACEAENSGINISSTGGGC